MTPRDSSGDEIEVDEEDDPGAAPVYEDDFAFDDWQPTWEDFFKEIGLLDVRDGMIEYETGNNSRMFIMLAEMQQSNPYLKTEAELAQDNALMEVFLNGIENPLKVSSQSQKVEMTDFLNTLKDHSQYLKSSTKQMKEYAKEVINSTLDYQSETDRFENRAYMQFMTLVQPDEIYGDTPEVIERQIHEKAQEKLLRQIANSDGILRRADHSLQPLDTFGLMEVLYKTLNRESSVKIRLEDIFKNQNFTLFTTAKQSDKMFKEVQQKIQIEQEIVNNARDTAWLQQEEENQRLLAKGQDYYSTDDKGTPENEEENDDLNYYTTSDDLSTNYDKSQPQIATPVTNFTSNDNSDLSKDLSNMLYQTSKPEQDSHKDSDNQENTDTSDDGGIDISGLDDLN